MTILLNLGLIVAGTVLLVLAADWLVMGASAIARRLGVSSFVVGLTVVAFGTSAPELATSVRDAIYGSGAIALGNVVGSNIANIGLILGATALVRAVPVHAQAVRKDVPVMIGVSMVGIVAMLGDRIERWEGLFLVAMLGWYTFDAYRSGRREGIEERRRAAQLAREVEHQLADTPAPSTPPTGPFWLRNLVLVAIGVVGLAGGADLLVRGASAVAAAIGIPQVIIGLTLVAVGTSLPELATSVRAAMRNEIDIAVGNIVGSNVFNLLCVLGFASLIVPIDVPPEIIRRDVWIMLGFAIASLPVVMNGRRVYRVEGGLLLLAYAGYCVWLYRSSTP